MTENEIVRIEDKSLDNAISAYKTTIKVFEKSKDSDYCTTLDKVTVALLEELKQYRAIGTIEEFKDLKEYKVKMEMQYLDDINNPLEPLKLSSALQSEIFKYNYRKEHKPQDINPLDYTIMYALKHCLEEQMEET